MKYQIICDNNSCTIKRKTGIWPFSLMRPVSESFSIYGHTFDMTWPDASSAQEYIEQILDKTET